jgi:hypothetical protein
MTAIRPCDASGDILPVSSVKEMITGADAVGKHVLYRLKFLTGEWWEYPERGNQIFQMMQADRLSSGDSQAIASYLSSYIMETDGVMAVDEVRTEVNGRAFLFSCRVITTEGNVELEIGMNDLV